MIVKDIPSMSFDEFISEYKDNPVFTGDYYTNMLKRAGINVKMAPSEAKTEAEKQQLNIAKDIKNNSLLKGLLDLRKTLTQQKLDARVYPQTDGTGALTGYDIVVYNPLEKSKVLDDKGNYIDKEGVLSSRRTFDIAFEDTVQYGHSKANEFADVVDIAKNKIIRLKTGEAEFEAINEEIRRKFGNKKATDTRTNVQIADAGFFSAKTTMKQPSSKTPTDMQDRDKETKRTGSQSIDSLKANQVNLNRLLYLMRYVYGVKEKYYQKAMEILGLVANAENEEKALKLFEQRAKDFEEQGFDEKVAKYHGKTFKDLKELIFSAREKGYKYAYSGNNEDAFKHSKASIGERNDVAGDVLLPPVKREQGRKATHNILHNEDEKKLRAMFVPGIFASRMGEAKGIKYASEVVDEKNDNRIAYDALVRGIEMSDTELAEQGASHLSVKEGQSVISEDLAKVIDTSHITKKETFSKDDIEKTREKLKKKYNDYKKKLNKGKELKDNEKSDFDELSQIFGDTVTDQDKLENLLTRMYRGKLTSKKTSIFKMDENSPDRVNLNIFDNGNGSYTVSGEERISFEGGRKGVDSAQHLRTSMTKGKKKDFETIHAYSNGKAAGSLADYNIQVITGRSKKDAREYGTVLEGDLLNTLVDAREGRRLSDLFKIIEDDSSQKIKEGDEESRMKKQTAKFFKDILTPAYEAGKVYTTDYSKDITDFLEGKTKKEISYVLNYLDTIRDSFGGNAGLGKVYGLDKDGNLYRTGNSKIYYTNLGGDASEPYGDTTDKGAADLYTGHDSLVRALSMSIATMSEEEKEKTFGQNRKNKSIYDISKEISALIDIPDKKKRELKKLRDSNDESTNLMKKTLTKGIDVKNLDKSKYVTIGKGKGYTIDVDELMPEKFSKEDPNTIVNEEETLTYRVDQERKRLADEANNERTKKIMDLEKELDDLKKKGDQKEIENKQKQIDEIKKQKKVSPNDFQAVIDLQGNTFGNYVTYDGGKTYKGMGGRAIYLDRDNGSLKGYSERGYHTDLNRIVDPLKSGDSKKIIEYANDLVPEMRNSPYTKEGSDFKRLAKNKMSHSFSGSATGVNVANIMTQEEYEREMAKPLDKRNNLKLLQSDIASSGIEISLDAARAFFEGKSANGNKRNLWSTKELKRKLAEFGLTYTKDGEAREIKDMDRGEVLGHLYEVLTTGSDDWKRAYASGTYTKGIEALLGRFPLMNGLDVDPTTKVFIGQGLEGKEIRIGAGIAKKENGDFDGDHEAGKFVKLRSKQGQIFDKMAKDRENVTRRLAWIAKAEYERKDADRQVFSDDFDKGATEELISHTAEIAMRKNKASIGMLSNFATQIRNMMKDLGFDETSMLGTEEDTQHAAEAIIIRTYFEGIEQDLISSKKVINQLVKKRNMTMEEMKKNILESMAKNEKLSVEELTKKYGKEGLEKKVEEQLEQELLDEQKKVLDNVQELIRKFQTGEITFEGLQKDLIDMGVLDEKGGVANRVTQQALLEIEYNMKGGKDILKKIFNGKYRQFDLYGKATQQDVDFAKTFEGEDKGGFEAWSKTEQAKNLFDKLDKAGVKDYDKKDFYEMLLSGKVGLEDYGYMSQDVYDKTLTDFAVYARDAGDKTQDGTKERLLRSASYKTYSPEKKDYGNPNSYDRLSQEEVAAIEDGEKGIRAATGKFSDAIAKLKSSGGEIGNALAIILEALQNFAGGASDVAGAFNGENKPMTAAQGAKVLEDARFLSPYSTTKITGAMFPHQGKPGEYNYDPNAVRNALANKDKKFLGYNSEKEMRETLGDGLASGSSVRGSLYTAKTQFFTQLQDIASKKGWKWKTNDDLEALFESNKETLEKEKDSNVQVADLFKRKEDYDRNYNDYFDFLKAVHGENGYNDEKFFLAKNRVKRYEDLLPGWEEQLEALNKFYSVENRAKIGGETVDMMPEAGFLGVTGRAGDVSYIGRTDLAALRNVPFVSADGTTTIYKSLDLTDVKTKMGKALNAGDILQGIMNSYAARQDIYHAKEYMNKNKDAEDKGYSKWITSKAFQTLKQRMEQNGEKNVDWEKYYNQLIEANTARSMILKTFIDPKTHEQKSIFYSLDQVFEDIGHTEIMDQVDKFAHGQLTRDQMIQYLNSMVTQMASEGVNVISSDDEQKPNDLKYADESTTQEDVAKDYLKFMKQKNALIERRKTVNYLLKDTSNKKTDEERLKLEKEADDIEEKLKQIDENIRIAKEMEADLSKYDENGKTIDVGKEIRTDKRQQKAIHDTAIQEEQAKAKQKLETALTKMADIQARMQERTIRSNAVGLHGLSEEQKLAYAMANKQDQSEYDALARSVQGVDWEKAIGGADQMAEVTNKVTEATEAANQRLVAINADLNPTIWKQLTMSVKGYFNQMVRGQLVWKIMGQLQRSIRTLIEDAKKLDSVLVNLQIVTGDTRENTRGLITTYASLAKQMSVTTSEVAAAANDWLRQGYSVSESIDLVTASLQLSKLGMIDSGKATSYLTSMLKGFKLEAGDAVSIVDKLTKIDMSAATSAGDIAEALRQFATTAQLSGMDLNESIAMATTIMDVSQKDASSTGNAIKTILSRFGNVKAGTYSGMNITGDQNETTESLNDIEKVLRKIGISLRSSNLEFREFDDVLDDIASKWDTLDSVSKNAIATAMAGTRQRESFLVLMENYDKYKDFIEEAANAEGTAAEKYKAYEDSLEASQKKLSAAWEELASKTEVVDFFKTINKLGTQMLKWLPKLVRYTLVLFSGKVANSIGRIMSASGSLSLNGMGKLLRSFVSGGLVSEKLGWGKQAGSTLSRGGMIDSLIRKGTNPMLQELRIIAKNTTGLGAMRQTGAVLNASSSNVNGVAVNGQASLDDIIKNPSLSLGQKRKAVKNFYNSELDDIKPFKGSIYGIVIDEEAKEKYKKEGKKEYKKERKRIKKEKREFLSDLDHQSFMASRATDPQLADGTKLSDLKPHTGKIRFGKDKGKEYTYYTAKGHKGRISEKNYEALKQQQAADEENAENEYKNLKKAARTSRIVSGVASGAAAFFTADTTNGHKNRFTGEWEYNETNDVGAKIAMQSTSALLTGLGTYLLGPLGGMLGQLGADWFNKRVMGVFFPALQKENATRDRLNQAKETKEKISGLSSYLSTVIELGDKLDLSAEEYKKLSEAQQELKKYMLDPKNSGIKEEFVRYANEFLSNQEEGNGISQKSFDQLTDLTEMTSSEREQTVHALELAQLKLENETKLNDYEESLYGYYDEYDKAVGDIANKMYYNTDVAQTLSPNYSRYKEESEKALRRQYEMNGNTPNDSAVEANASKAARARSAETFSEDLNKMGINDKIAYLENKLDNEQVPSYVKEALEQTINQLKQIKEVEETIHKAVEKQRVAESIYDMQVGTNADGSKKTLLDLSQGALRNMGLDEIIEKIAEYMEKKFGGMQDGTSYFYTDKNGNKKLKSTAREGIISGLKSNEKIYRLINGQDLRLADVFGMRDGETKTEMLKRFANALSVSVGELQTLGDTFGNFTLGEVSKNAEELLSTLNDMESTILKIGGGTQSWAATLQTITKNYPELLGYASDEYSLSLALFQKMDDFKKLQADAQFSDIMSSETYFRNFSDKAKAKLSPKEAEEFSGLKITTMKDLQSYISNNSTELSKKLNDIAKEELHNIKLSAEAQMELAEKLVSIKNAQLDKEIDNLTSQKEALQEINSQREYENKLIEAKLKLESALKEKKRVWREGVGWVYEEDQAAISEAKDNLDSVTNEKAISSLTQQINQLNADKKNLNDILSDQQEDIQEGFLKAFEKSDGVTNGSLESFGSSIHDFINNSDEKADERWEEWKELYERNRNISADNLKDAWDDVVKYKNEMNKEGLSEEQRKVATERYNEALGNFQTQYNTGKSNGYWNEKDFEKGGEFYDQFGEGNEVSKAATGAVGWNKAAYDQSLYVHDEDGKWKKFTYNSDKNTNKISETEWNNFFEKDDGLVNKGGANFYNQGLSDAESGHRVWAAESVSDVTGKAIYNGAKNNPLITNFADWMNDFTHQGTTMIKMRNGNWYRMVGKNIVSLDSPEIVSENEVPEDVRKAGGKFKKGSLDISKGNKVPLLMNEAGTEAVVTPGGTITALPSHSGIVPADITSNLWNLGNYAPDLLSALQRQALLGMNVAGTSTDNSVDNSVSINTVQMTVDADSGFNVDSFVQQLQQVAALTRNNKH